MNRTELIQTISNKQSFLCVGLDTDIRLIPRHLLSESDPVFAFNKYIIDATYNYAVAYKPNIAFYECEGSKGWESLQKTMEYMPKDVLQIADAKRGDIGNTAQKYAQTFFETYSFNAVTVNPYMGLDTLIPYLKYKDKWTIVLALTSNGGSSDFEEKLLDSGLKLYEEVIVSSQKMEEASQIMYVVGATKPENLAEIRKLAPKAFFLVPGVGSQGGDLVKVCENGLTDEIGLLVNASRSIIYASSGLDFAKDAEKEAKKLRESMKPYIS